MIKDKVVLLPFPFDDLSRPSKKKQSFKCSKIKIGGFK
jgi:hypothetical protein